MTDSSISNGSRDLGRRRKVMRSVVRASPGWLRRSGVRVATRRWGSHPRFVLSYPKSGRTWLRFMVDHLLVDEQNLDVPHVFAVEWSAKNRFGIEWTHDRAAMKAAVPAWGLGGDTDGFEGRTGVLLARNALPTLNSAYFQVTERLGTFTGSPGEFVRSPVLGAPKLAAFYLKCADIRRRVPQLAVIHYDQLSKDPTATLEAVAAHLELPHSGESIHRAVEAGGFENMRQLATTRAYSGTVIAPTSHGNPGSAKVRSGPRNGGVSIFDESDRAFVKAVLAPLLDTEFAAIVPES